MQTPVYAVTVTRPDGSTVVHGRCFAHELAARAEAENLADGDIAWLSTRYGMDERGVEFEITRLTMWRLHAGTKVSSQIGMKPSEANGSDAVSPTRVRNNREPSLSSIRPGRLDDS